jgi:hypothetical protein
MEVGRAPARRAFLDLGQQEGADATPLKPGVDEQSPQAIGSWIDLGNADQKSLTLGHDGFGRPERIHEQGLRVTGKDSCTL